MIIGITGTVGSGKSGVASILSGFHKIAVIDTDCICRELLADGEPVCNELKRMWPHLYGHDGKLDRKKLRTEVFGSDEVRNTLEGVLHPHVQQRVRGQASLATESGRSLLVEVPLLFEVGWEGEFDHVIAVYCPRDISLKRTTARDRVPAHQVEKILDIQLSAEAKANRADTVIDNSTTWTAAVLQVSQLHTFFKERV